MAKQKKGYKNRFRGKANHRILSRFLCKLNSEFLFLFTQQSRSEEGKNNNHSRQIIRFFFCYNK